MSAFYGIFGVIAFLAAYFVPSMIGFSNNAKAQSGIFFLNLLLGWTVIGWVVCFIWSFSGWEKKESA